MFICVWFDVLGVTSLSGFTQLTLASVNEQIHPALKKYIHLYFLSQEISLWFSVLCERLHLKLNNSLSLYIICFYYMYLWSSIMESQPSRQVGAHILYTDTVCQTHLLSLFTFSVFFCSSSK